MLCDAHSEKEIETFKEDVPGSPYYLKSTVLYSLDSLHKDSSFVKTVHSWNRGQLSVTLRSN